MKSGEFARAEKKFIIERKRKIEKMLPETMKIGVEFPDLKALMAVGCLIDFLRY